MVSFVPFAFSNLFFDKSKAHFLDEVEFDTPDGIDTLMDFLAHTLFTTEPAALETSLKDAEAALSACSHMHQCFSLEPSKLFADVSAFLQRGYTMKAENIALGLIYEYKDKPVKLKRMLENHLDTAPYNGVWKHVHGHVQIAVEYHLPSGTPAAKKPKGV